MLEWQLRRQQRPCLRGLPVDRAEAARKRDRRTARASLGGGKRLASRTPHHAPSYRRGGTSCPEAHRSDDELRLCLQEVLARAVRKNTVPSYFDRTSITSPLLFTSAISIPAFAQRGAS